VYFLCKSLLIPSLIPLLLLQVLDDHNEKRKLDSESLAGVSRAINVVGGYLGNGIGGKIIMRHY
jgi:hypothetical protein